jgi:hypothetical protein
MKSLPISAIATFSIALASCKTVAPSTARLEIGDPFSYDSFEVRGASASKRIVRDNRKRQKTVSSRSLTPSEVADFWKTLDQAAIEQWKADYQPAHLDGRTAYTSWTLSVNRNGHPVESQGYAAYPSDNEPGGTSSLVISHRYQSVYDAFKKACAPREP